MSRIFALVLFLFLNSYAQTFSVATYNVQNLFDLNIDGTEYDEFKSKKWNKTAYKLKLNNIAKVIQEINADIIALQEVESIQALNDLQKLLPQYSYKNFTKDSSSAIGVGVLSKILPMNDVSIPIETKHSYYRPILHLEFKLENKNFHIFINHWKSKRSSESYRIDYAHALYKQIKMLPKNSDYIILGDLNSNYNENQTFEFDTKLNDTYGITGINDILNHDKDLINLWHEVSIFNRFSYIYKGEKTTPDHIIISQNLFDNLGVSYIDKSFKVFKPEYLYANNSISKKYSDHLPVIAQFSTLPYKAIENNHKMDTISSLYEVEKLEKPIVITDAMVVYKDKNNAIIKQKNNRSIYLYNCAQDLSEGYLYDLEIHEIKTYKGLKEITKLNLLKKSNSTYTINNYLIDYKSVNLFEEKYQNELITDLEGIYNNGYLYFDKKKIKLYFKEKKLLPKNGQKVIIRNAHLSNYKTKVQLVIYKQRDFDAI